MTWVVGLILLLVVLPVVVVLLNNVLAEANSIVPSIGRIRDAARAGSKDLDAVPLSADDAGPGHQDSRRCRQLRRLPRRDPGRRVMDAVLLSRRSS